MSPEQAAGNLEELGPASDVYSLGATLYHLLCGRPPFLKEELGETLARIASGQFPRPSELKPATPRGLEAICLKAMALRPADRYASARLLADDLEHWLADEPVAAAPDGLGERISRFGRRHKGLLRAAAAAFVLVTAISVAAALLIDRQRREKERLADEKSALGDEKSALAERNLNLANAEREARELADGRAEELQSSLARSRFDAGVREYDAGVREYDTGAVRTGLTFLLEACTAAPPGDPYIASYKRVLIDRCMDGGRLLAPADAA
jgi:hypothetical protein